MREEETGIRTIATPDVRLLDRTLTRTITRTFTRTLFTTLPKSITPIQ
jgi:hypothetical protein